MTGPKSRYVSLGESSGTVQSTLTSATSSKRRTGCTTSLTGTSPYIVSTTTTPSSGNGDPVGTEDADGTGEPLDGTGSDAGPVHAATTSTPAITTAAIRSLRITTPLHTCGCLGTPHAVPRQPHVCRGVVMRR